MPCSSIWSSWRWLLATLLNRLPAELMPFMAVVKPCVIVGVPLVADWSACPAELEPALPLLVAICCWVACCVAMPRPRLATSAMRA